ncbi:polysaccharide pyruvyl transferase family protein [Elioraea sp.]|uniref:polysaccharide pyruvyl transferase family protein n=1 Tax=Elioraea sp. TaxID=2185103 RepID=UPI0025C66DD5|nr:polysaccharide pyruvyl transferase family protein [Elioraea sp.]
MTGTTFVLQGYYGTGNFGDDWLLAATATALAAAVPDARFVVRDHGDAVLMPLPADLRFSGSEHVLGDATLPRVRRLARYAATAWRQFGAAEWLVFGGGTQFHARGGLASLSLSALLCLLARVRGVRIAALGVGVSGLSGPVATALLRVIVGSARVFVVRDEASRSIAGPRAVLAADLAFGLPLTPGSAPGAAVALTAYPPAWSPSLVAAMAVAVAGRDVVLLTVQRAGVTPGDDAALEALATTLPGAAWRVMTGNAAALAGVGLVCGMRFHALLAAAQAGIPFVGIAHDPKIADLCARFAMPCLAPEDVTASTLAAAIAAAADRRPAAEALAACRTEAARNIAALAPHLA